MGDELIQNLILMELQHNPDGLTTRQIHKRVRRKLKLIKKYKKNQEKNEKILDKIIK